jgi:hypothetical protein
MAMGSGAGGNAVRRAQVTLEKRERKSEVGASGRARAAALTLSLCLLASCATVPPPHPLPPPAPAEIAEAWPRREVLDLAMHAYQCGDREGRFERPVLTIIDYSLPSSAPRLWVIDVQRKQVLHHELVAHGEGSGDTVPVAFSNERGSHQSSLGLFRTDEVYTGRFGYSLRLSGLEPGINDKARERAIVVHGFSDVSRAFAAKWGTIGRSWGCPAVPEDVAPQIIDSIAGGSALFAYYPDPQWLRQSHYLHCDVQLAGTAGGQLRQDRGQARREFFRLRVTAVNRAPRLLH